MFRPVTTIRTQMTSNLAPIVITSRLLSNSSFEISDHTIVLRRATIRTIRIQTPSQICIPSPPQPPSSSSSSSSSSTSSSASCFYNNFVTPYIQIETDEDDDDDDDDDENDDDDDDDDDDGEENDVDREEDEREINQVDGEEENEDVRDNLVENVNFDINIDGANQHININGNVNAHDDDNDVDIDYDIGNNAHAAVPQQPLNIVAINSYFRSSGYGSFDIDTLRELNIVDDRHTYRKIPWHLLPAEEKRRIFAESRAYGHLNFLNVTEK